MNKVTIFTPCFNRAHTLPRLYNSILDQSECLYEWVIVDDGSEDETEKLVAGWVAEKKINIRFFKKANGGMLSAHNVAFDHINSEIFMCIDSDDFLAPVSLEVVCKEYEGIRFDKEVAGLVGLDVRLDGSIVGENFPSFLQETTFKEIRFKYKIRGDKKYVFKKKVIDEFGKYPEFEGEHYPAASLLYRMIDNKYKLKVLNIPLCTVDYQTDGNSAGKIRQYFKNPESFKHYRLFCMDDSYDLKEKIISAVHYVSSCIMSKKIIDIFNNRHFFWTSISLPAGVFLYLYLKITPKKGFIKIGSED